MNVRFLRAGQSLAAALALAISSGAFAQTTPGTDTTAQPTSPPGAQPASPPNAPSTAQPAYPSSEAPRGTTPQQREQTQQQSGHSARCNQQDELARSECLRRDMTDDDLPAGATRSMQQRKQEQAEQQAQESMNVASEADTGSDQAGARSRTRTATSPVPGSQEQRAVQDKEQSEDDTQAQQPATDANNPSDTLGRER